MIGEDDKIGTSPAAGVDTEQQTQMVRRGTESRRVLCMHCKTIMAADRQSTCVCAGCGRHLKIKALYSRRYDALQGVAISPDPTTPDPAQPAPPCDDGGARSS